MKAVCAKNCLAGGDPCFWLNLAKQGKFKEAWIEIVKYNPLPAVIGRVCPHPCEDVCKRALLDEPISINVLEGHIGELALANSWRLPVTIGKRKNFFVAVVGTGPAGLSCAYQLARQKYRVEIFDELPVLGGAMRVGIPEFRLPRNILDREIANILMAGITVRVAGLHVDANTLERIKDSYDAVFIATGLQKSRKLNIHGEDAENVLYGLEFLKKVNLGEPVSLGKRVIVIGGGNVAIDAARTAKRYGCKVSIFYRRSRAEMPALETEIIQALAEGVKIEGLALPVEISEGLIKFQRAELGAPDETGRKKPVPIEGAYFARYFDSLIIAAGEEKDRPFFAGDDAKFFVVKDEGTVAEAIKAGREAAFKLIGAVEQKAENQPVLPEDADFYLTPEKRISVGRCPASAVKEAKRCLGCGFETEGIAEVLIDEERCKGCGLCLDVCPVQILELANYFNSRGYKPAVAKGPKKCRGCTWCKLVCPDGAIKIRKED